MYIMKRTPHWKEPHAVWFQLLHSTKETTLTVPNNVWLYSIRSKEETNVEDTHKHLTYNNSLYNMVVLEAYPYKFIECIEPVSNVNNRLCWHQTGQWWYVSVGSSIGSHRSDFYHFFSNIMKENDASLKKIKYIANEVIEPWEVCLAKNFRKLWQSKSVHLEKPPFVWDWICE